MVDKDEYTIWKAYTRVVQQYDPGDVAWALPWAVLEILSLLIWMARFLAVSNFMKFNVGIKTWSNQNLNLLRTSSTKWRLCHKWGAWHQKHKKSTQTYLRLGSLTDMLDFLTFTASKRDVPRSISCKTRGPLSSKVHQLIWWSTRDRGEARAKVYRNSNLTHYLTNV